MLLNLLCVRMFFRIEAEPLVEIIRLIFAPAIPLQWVIREIEGRLGFEIEHGEVELTPRSAANLVPGFTGPRVLFFRLKTA